MVLTNLIAAPIEWGIVLGVLAAILGWLSSNPSVWDWRKFAYTIGISIIAALGVINSQYGGSVNDSNVLNVILSVLGAGFTGNKLIQIAGKLRTKVTKTS